MVEVVVKTNVGDRDAMVRTGFKQATVKKDWARSVAAVAYVLREVICQAGYVLVLLRKRRIPGLYTRSQELFDD
jgi:hypothetical protein